MIELNNKPIYEVYKEQRAVFDRVRHDLILYDQKEKDKEKRRERLSIKEIAIQFFNNLFE